VVARCGVAHAMEGMFDRSAEVDKYIGLMKTGDTGTLAVVAKEISVSDFRSAIGGRGQRAIAQQLQVSIQCAS